ncbi:MAG: TIGR04076 family protein, partial [Butyrivibrio sp.]|nr:TIGR04076 family protein [Butyrivibrio sp.]
MKHKVKITVIKKECYEDLQEKYLAVPKSGACPMFEVGQEFILDGHGFQTMNEGHFCMEAWDAIIRVSVPMIVYSLVISIAAMFINSNVNVYGIAASAVDGIGSKINMIIAGITTGVYTNFAQQDASEKGGKAAAFDFLGFTHYCSTNKET